MGLLQWILLAQVCSCGGHCLESVLAEFTDSGLFQQRSLAQAFSHRYPWLGPAPSYLVQQSYLAQVCSLGGHSVVPASVEVAALGLLWLKSLAQACFSEGH